MHETETEWRFHHWPASRPPRRCWLISRGWNGTISSAGRIRTIPPSRSASGPAGTAEHPCAARSTSRTSWRSPRRSATTGMSRRITGPLYMGKDTHALSGPAQRTALEVLAANEVRDRDPARRRLHADAGRSRTPSSSTIAGAATASPTASSSRPRTIRRRTAASSTIRPTAGRPTPTSPSGSRTRANALLRERQCRGEAAAAAGRHQQRKRRISSDFMRPYVEDLRNVIDMDAIRGAKLRWRSTRWAAPPRATGT